MPIKDVMANQFAEQYRGLLTTIAGHFARALDSHDPTTPKARSDFRTNLARASEIFMSGIATQLQAQTYEVRNGALDAQGVVLSDPDFASLNEYLNETVEDLCGALWACIYRDDLTAERELRKVALNVDLLQSTTGMSRIGAIIKTKFGRVSGMSFVQVDRLGRKRVSESYVRSLVRRHLVLTDVETRLFAMAKQGNDLAQVLHQDGTQAEVFSITGASRDCPSYEEIRDTVFHPNATATVIAFKE